MKGQSGGYFTWSDFWAETWSEERRCEKVEGKLVSQEVMDKLYILAATWQDLKVLKGPLWLPRREDSLGARTGAGRPVRWLSGKSHQRSECTGLGARWQRAGVAGFRPRISASVDSTCWRVNEGEDSSQVLGWPTARTAWPFTEMGNSQRETGCCCC